MEITGISDFRGFAELKPIWELAFTEAGASSPFLAYSWFEAWLECFAENHRLDIILVREPSRNWTGIAPLMRLGTRLVFPANHEVTDYCDFLYPRGRGIDFFKALFDHVQSCKTHVTGMDLINVKSDSPSVAIITDFADQRQWKWSLSVSEAVPILTLPRSDSDYLSGLKRKSRHELRRKAVRIKKLPDIAIQRFQAPGEILEAVEDFIGLHRLGSPEKAEFWQKPGMFHFFKEIALKFSKMGWIEIANLYSGKRLIASLLSLVYQQTVFLYNVAFDRKFAEFSPGIYLIRERIRQAIAENRRSVDFLRGREKYKYDFGARDSKIVNLKVDFGDFS